MLKNLVLRGRRRGPGGTGCSRPASFCRVRWGRLPEPLGSAPAFLLLEPLLLLTRGNPGRNPLGWAPVPALQALPEAAQCRGLVPVLAPLLPAGDHHPRGQVDQPDPAFGPVLVLASLSPGHEGLHPALRQELVVGVGNGKGLRRWGFVAHATKMGHRGGNAMEMALPLQRWAG